MLIWVGGGTRGLLVLWSQNTTGRNVEKLDTQDIKPRKKKNQKQDSLRSTLPNKKNKWPLTRRSPTI